MIRKILLRKNIESLAENVKAVKSVLGIANHNLKKLASRIDTPQNLSRSRDSSFSLASLKQRAFSRKSQSLKCCNIFPPKKGKTFLSLAKRLLIMHSNQALFISKRAERRKTHFQKSWKSC